MNKEFEESLARLREVYKEVSRLNQEQEEAFWDSLTPEQQLDVFCAVVRRIHKAEIIDRGSYRHALYDVFGFSMDSYSRGMDCGYLDIHNAIVVDKDESELVK